MRRGLLTWDEKELPVEVLEARVSKLRKLMQRDGLDALVAYTNIAKPAAVSWLSGFTPYWSEGLLYVPSDGPIAFATALSKRVAEWISTVMPTGEIIPTPQPGSAIGKKLSSTGARKVGIIDLDDIPARQVKDLLGVAAELSFVDATEAFNIARAEVDDAERQLVRKAAEIAVATIQRANPDARTAQELIARCEGFARTSGAEEVFISCIPDLSRDRSFHRTDTAAELSETFALRISLAYKGGWVRFSRSFARDPKLAEKFALTELRFSELSLPLADAAAQLAGAFKDADAKLHSWVAEQPRGSYPLVPVAGSLSEQNSLNLASPCTVNVECTLNGMRWISARAFC
jgi:hypothetical protein